MKNLKALTAVFSALLIATACQSAQAQYNDGLPMQDSFGGGGGVFGLDTPTRSPAGGLPRTTGSFPNPYPSATRSAAPVRQPQQSRSAFIPQTNSFSPQQAQEIANAVAALGPAMQQARANMQQIRAQNGGYLIPRNNNSGFRGFGNGQAFQQQQRLQPLAQAPRGFQRYSDTFGMADARRVSQGLIGSGYRNVRIAEHPDNGRRVRQGLPRIFGVYHR